MFNVSLRQTLNKEASTYFSLIMKYENNSEFYLPFFVSCNVYMLIFLLLFNDFNTCLHSDFHLLSALQSFIGQYFFNICNDLINVNKLYMQGDGTKGSFSQLTYKYKKIITKISQLFQISQSVAELKLPLKFLAFIICTNASQTYGIWKPCWAIFYALEAQFLGDIETKSEMTDRI